MKRSAGWNQEVTDEEGRRRFHGAFTGGFSAGYFNSVGTKEGWQPATFSSSRQERGRVQQRAEDFMDEDDDPLLGKRLETTAQYDTLQARVKQQQQQQRLAVEDKPRNAFEAQVLNMTQRPATVSAYPTMNFLDDLVRPVNDSIGAKLLNQMGWKEGHGIGPRIRKKKISDNTKQVPHKQLTGSALHEADDHTAEEEVVYIPPRNTIDVSAFPKPKLDKYGAGFDPYVNAPEFSRYKQHQENELAQKQQKRQVVTFADAMKATSGSYETVTAFGLSALEDNDDLDVYGAAAMSEFDTAIGPARLTNGKEVKLIDSEARESLSHGAKKHRRAPAFGTDGRPALPGFELAYMKEKPSKVVVMRLKVPSDFKPFHQFNDDDDDKRNGQSDPAAALYQKHNFTTGKHGQGSLMTAKQRAVLLGESRQTVQKVPDAESLSGTASGGSVFDLLGAEQKARIFAVAAQAKMKSAPQTTADVAPLNQAPKEREPLVKGAVGNQFRANISASIAKRFVSASSTSDEQQQDGGDQGTAEKSPSTTTTVKKSYRTESMWIPSSLLCKRFHVKCLVGNTTGREVSANEEKRDLFDKELVPHLVEFAAERRVNQRLAPTTDVPAAGTLNAQSVPSRSANSSHAREAKDDDEELPPLPIVEKPAASLLKSIFEPSDESDVEEEDDDDEASDNEDDDDEDEAEKTEPIGVADVRVSIDQNSLTITKVDRRSVGVPGNDTKRDERLPRGEKDGAAGISSNADESSSSSSGSEDEDKPIRSATADAIRLRGDAAGGASATDSERDRKNKKKKDSKKHKHKRKQKKHHRSSRHDEVSDDSEDDEADRKLRKKRKEAKKSSSSSSRKKKSSSSPRKRSRSASRDRSETRSSKSSKHHRRH